MKNVNVSFNSMYAFSMSHNSRRRTRRRREGEEWTQVVRTSHVYRVKEWTVELEGKNLCNCSFSWLCHPLPSMCRSSRRREKRERERDGSINASGFASSVSFTCSLIEFTSRSSVHLVVSLTWWEEESEWVSVENVSKRSNDHLIDYNLVLSFSSFFFIQHEKL